MSAPPTAAAPREGAANFELFIAFRYLKSKRKGLFTWITTIIGIAGVSIGVAALIVILSVMNGFQSDIQQKIVGAQAHVTVYARMDDAKMRRLEQALGSDRRIVDWSPFVLGQAIMTYGDRSTGVILKGIDPAREFKVNELYKTLKAGSWAGLTAPAPTNLPPAGSSPKGRTAQAPGAGGKGPVPPGVVLGEELARSLGVWVGDEVVLISPQSLSTPLGLVPNMKKFQVVGTLRTGYYEYDSGMAYTSLAAAAQFFQVPGGVSGVQVKVRRLSMADAVAETLRAKLGFDFTVRSFTQMNQTLFAALKLEKLMMFIIVTLIILVAAFNIASNLILMCSDKLRDVGLLRAMGATPREIRRIFLWVGSLIGVIGVGAGLFIGLAICWVIHRYPIIELPADIYYLTRLPVHVEAWDVGCIVLCALFLSVAAAIYPAFRASRVDPITAIHYG